MQAGPTAKSIEICDGLNLVVAPKRLLPVWVKEWHDTVKPHPLLQMTLLLGHGTPIQGVQTVRELGEKKSLMIAEAEDWVQVCVCMVSNDSTLHMDEAKAAAAAAW